jgi:ABC-type glycerol-3-phosphate transport system substrate-binding protein
MKISPFQIGVIVFFALFIILGMLVFSGVIGKQKTDQQVAGSAITVWGPYPDSVMSKLISDYNASHQKNGTSITYVSISSSTMDDRLAEAVASGTGPDLVIIGQDQILKNRSKLATIPYANLPEATFRSTFVGGGELFMMPNGVLGLPLTINPLIMYYNRDLLEGAGITLPPKTWNDVVRITPALTKKDANTNILQSALPFGIYTNLNNARSILSMLLLQAGNPIITKQAETFTPVLGVSSNLTAGNQGVSTAQTVIDFFTQFVDPTKDTYTWNRSFTNARNKFISGELALYIGYASELPLIVAQNPNLNFDISKVPQPATTGSQVTFGDIHAIALVKASKNPAVALSVASELTGADFAAKIVSGLLSVVLEVLVRCDLLSQVFENVFTLVLYGSVIIF